MHVRAGSGSRPDQARLQYLPTCTRMETGSGPGRESLWTSLAGCSTCLCMQEPGLGLSSAEIGWAVAPTGVHESCGWSGRSYLRSSQLGQSTHYLWLSVTSVVETIIKTTCPYYTRDPELGSQVQLLISASSQCRPCNATGNGSSSCYTCEKPVLCS